jgi:hypothetical protein
VRATDPAVPQKVTMATEVSFPDPDLLDPNLESLKRCLKRIEEKTPTRVDVFIHDYDAL